MPVITFREALRKAMIEEMERDPEVFVMGEEVAQYQGTFRVTEGLLDKFGPERVIDTPISEEGFTAVSVGAAMMGVLCLTGAMPFEAPAVSVVLAGVEVPWFVPLLWVAAVATTLGYALGVMAVPRIGSRVASFVGLSEVLFALGFAWVFLAEVPAPVQFAGGALILAGVILVKVDDLRREPAPPVTPTAASVPLP